MIRRYTRGTAVLEVVLWIAAIMTLLPLLGLVNMSFKPKGDASGPWQVAAQYTLANYGAAWETGSLGPALANSALITIVSVALILVISAMAAYPLARIGSRLTRGAFLLLLAGLIIPGQLGILPLFALIRDLNLIGTPWGVIFVNVGGALPFAIFILTAFLREQPRDYEEAAALDGCGPVRAFVHVVSPMMRPALGTVAILNIIATWNNFFIALLLLSGSGNETVPLRINGFVREYSADWNLIFAALVISTAPILACYFAMQKHIIRGFSGGVKG